MEPIQINLKILFMQEKNQNNGEERNKINHIDNPGHGAQGIDKAPGEEPSEDNIQFTSQSQKGKKVDADLTKEQDRPLDKQDL
jgi:hypothetical protein